jgi:hypothetical protein
MAARPDIDTSPHSNAVHSSLAVSIDANHDSDRFSFSLEGSTLRDVDASVMQSLRLYQTSAAGAAAAAGSRVSSVKRAKSSIFGVPQTDDTHSDDDEEEEQEEQEEEDRYLTVPQTQYQRRRQSASDVSSSAAIAAAAEEEEESHVSSTLDSRSSHILNGNNDTTHDIATSPSLKSRESGHSSVPKRRHVTIVAAAAAEAESESHIAAAIIDDRIAHGASILDHAMIDEQEKLDTHFSMSVLGVEQAAAVQLSWSVFWKELIYHIFQPLFIPFLYFAEGGWIGLYNRFFIGVHWITAFGTVVWILTVAVNIVYFLGHSDGYTALELVTMNTLFTLRSIAIAVKYAYMPPEENELRFRRRYTTAQAYSRLLTRGWMRLAVRTIRKELLMATTRTGCDLHSLYFTFDHSTASGHALRDLLVNALKRHEELFKVYGTKQHFERLKNGEVNCELLVTQFALDSAAKYDPVKYGVNLLSLSTAIASVIYAASPTITRSIVGDDAFGTNWAGTFCVVTTFFVTAYELMADLQFIGVAIVDFKRRLFISRQLSSMLSVRYRGQTLRDMIGVPTIDLYERGSQNLLGWLFARRVFKDFGRGFFLRMQLFLSFFLGVVVFWALCFIVISVGRGSFSADEVVPLSLVTFIVVSGLVYMVSIGKKLNNQQLEHRHILVNIEARLHKLMYLQHLPFEQQAPIKLLEATRGMVSSLQDVC